MIAKNVTFKKRYFKGATRKLIFHKSLNFTDNYYLQGLLGDDLPNDLP